MENYQIFFSIMSAVTLFLFGLSALSKELKAAAGTKLQSIMAKVSANRFVALLGGLFFTAIIQSSTAVSSLAISLVDSGLLSFAGAVAIMLGSYVGTTATVWLVSLKMTGIGPVFIVLGSLINLLPIKAKVFGKALFYFGFIFFTLDLISTSLGPLKENPQLMNLLLHTNTPIKGILVGILLTVILQSSTVVTGLAIIFVQQGLLVPQDSIPIVMGANVGTTATALFASIKMGMTARKAAVANTLINTIGVILFFPFMVPFTEWVLSLAPTPSMVVAIAHLGFNVALMSIFIALLTPFVRFMDRIFSIKA